MKSAINFHYSAFLLCGIFSISILFSSCKKDEDLDPDPQTPVLTGTVNAMFIIQVLDQNEQPLSGASVSIGNVSETTTSDGTCFLNSTSFPSGKLSVNAQKSGYFKHHTVVNSSNGTHFVRIKLSQTINAGSFNSAIGGTINVPNGGTIVFPANSIADQNGNAYTGTVNVSAVYIDPTSAIAANLMPNHFMGKAQNDEDYFLENHGAFLVELSAGFGQEMQIADGSFAEINIPLGNFDQGAASPILPLYSFNENLGYWIEEGEASLDGNFYSGNVSHFTFWMCPLYYEHYFLSGTLNCQSEVLPYTEVKTYNLWGAYLGSDITNAGGGFSGMIPEILTFDLVVEDPCGNVAYSQSIGPFSDDTFLDPINVCSGNANYSTITGNLVDCENDPYIGGLARIQSNGVMHFLPSNNQGEVFGSVLFCNGATEFSAMGIDLETGESSIEQNIAIEDEVDFGALSICGESIEFVQFTLDGTDYYFTQNEFANLQAAYNVAQDRITLGVLSGAFMNETQFYINLEGSVPGNYNVGGNPFAFSFVLLGNDGTDFLDVTINQAGTQLGSVVSGSIQNTIFHDSESSEHSLENCSFHIEIDYILE